MDTQTIRKKYLDFFAARNHEIIPSASIVPENDPTTLFTGSGMQPLLPYLLGEKHPKGNRLTNSQKSFRAEDIDEVGDNRHTTFFEMLGNWSLGDYFKQEQLPWFFEFLTKEVGLDPKNLYVTVFDGAKDIGMPRDEESIEIWTRLFNQADISSGFQAVGSEADGYRKGMEEGARIFSYDAKKNWWSRAGVPGNMPVGEPGGPDSEVFYDFGIAHDSSWGKHCHPNCDCGRFLEIGNSVFMEYMKTEAGFEKLAQRNVDFGGGLERIAAAAAHTSDMFLAVDSLEIVIRHLEEASGKKYEDDVKGFRIIADHLRGAVFMIGDGVLPSNTEQGYFVRRLLRRSVQYADTLGIQEGTLVEAIPSITAAYKIHYPELERRSTEIASVVGDEEARFRSTLRRGLIKLQKVMLKHESEADKANNSKKTIPAKEIFEVITSDGFPKELVEEILGKHDAETEWTEIDALILEHKAKSRAGAEQKFKGGLADHSIATTRLHTTHHLLLKALQIVLGDQVKQRGSNITGERLRIDFSHGNKLTDTQRSEVEHIVNQQIRAKLPVFKTTLPREEAERLGAEQEFGQKYPDMVTVYSIGPARATSVDPKLNEAFSLEFCGGPHVSNTGDIQGVFRIAKEKASSAGVRRIQGVLE